MNPLDIIKTIKGLFAFLGFLFLYWTGKQSEKNKQRKYELKNIRENQEFKQKLDAVSIADKRKFLRDRFPKP